MAENRVTNEDEEKGGGGGGNKNALAYGLLQGAGYRTEGMSPADAWAMVDALHLMDRESRKKTDDDKSVNAEKKKLAKQSGVTKDSVVQKAGKNANHVSIHTDNVAAANEAVDTINSLMDEYGLSRLDRIQTQQHLGHGIFSASASANGKGLNIHRGFLTNPQAFYRNAVQEYNKYGKAEIARLEADLQKHNSPAMQQRLESKLKKAKEKVKFSRHNVCYKGDEVKSVITHEMGHCIADQLCGQINGRACLKKGISDSVAEKKRNLIKSTYDEACKNGDIYKISEYASTNEHEFFAETFAMWKIGKEKIPENIEKMIREVLS